MDHKESTSREFLAPSWNLIHYNQQLRVEHLDLQVDKHKIESLKKQKEGKGHWKPELASDSEEAVKADRCGPLESADEAMRAKTCPIPLM
jgi:hypothetical protein